MRDKYYSAKEVRDAIKQSEKKEEILKKLYDISGDTSERLSILAQIGAEKRNRKDLRGGLEFMKLRAVSCPEWR